MTRIIWVKGHVIHNDKLSETIEQIPSREVSIVKVGSIQEAICELFEKDGDVAFIICDQVLDASLPQQELISVAKRASIPFLMADDKSLYKFASKKDTCDVCGGKNKINCSRKATSLLRKLAANMQIKEVPVGVFGSDTVTA